MDEQKILQQLNKMNNIKADSEWKSRNRIVLLNQIFNSQPDKKNSAYSWPMAILKEWPLSMAKNVSKPLAVAVLILFFASSTSIASYFAARESKPGDSLYVAKIVGEKTQLALTFNENEKAKLGMQFASNRAEEITKVLSEHAVTVEEKEEKVGNLVENFKKEISDVKSRLAKINAPAESPASGPSVKNADSGEQEAETDPTAEEPRFFRADLGKNGQGVDLAEPEAQSSPDEAAVSAKTGASAPSEATAGDANEKASTTPAEAKAPSNPLAILEEAKALLEKKDYTAIISKLDEADRAISEQVGIGQNSEQESKKATSTTGVVANDNASSTQK